MKPSHLLRPEPKDPCCCVVAADKPRLRTDHIGKWCLFKKIAELFLEPLVFPLQPNLLSDIQERAAGVFARRIRLAPPPDPQWPAVVLAPDLEHHSLFVGSGCQQWKRIAHTALIFGSVG